MKLRLILGDQLNLHHPWLEKVNAEVLYVVMEMRQETDYAPHHIQKVVAFFGAMRSFNKALNNLGHKTHYLTLDDPQNTQDLTKNLQWLINEYSIETFEYQAPDEYRLDQQLKDFCANLSIATTMEDTHHFMTTREALEAFFSGNNSICSWKPVSPREGNGISTRTIAKNGKEIRVYPSPTFLKKNP